MFLPPIEIAVQIDLHSLLILPEVALAGETIPPSVAGGGLLQAHFELSNPSTCCDGRVSMGKMM
jgi:hypothetical protein